MSSGNDDSVFFPKNADGSYQATIRVNDAQGSLKEFNLLPDTGADLILLTHDNAQKLGYDLNMIRDNLHVQGIKGAPGDFKVVPCWVQIGHLDPIQAPVGLASTPDALEESLLGDKGVLDGGLTATYDARGVTYRKAVSGAYRSGISF